MKKIFYSILLIFAAALVSNVFAQRETPTGAGDKNLADNNIKMRSVELDRVKREAAKSEAASFAPINKELTAKFPRIKEDFEGIQILQAAVIKAYTTGKKIDYALIETSAKGISDKAKRLDVNLFAESKKDRKTDKLKEIPEVEKSVGELIVELDNAIGSFVESKIFVNFKVIEPESAIKTRSDLLDIIRLSERLSNSANKLK